MLGSLFGIQFCEKLFSRRVLDLGTGLLKKYLSLPNGPQLVTAPQRSIVIDLLPCFRELQMQGIMVVHEFLLDFANLLQTSAGQVQICFFGSYSVALLYSDKPDWTQEEVSDFSLHYFKLLQNYHCLQSAKATPDSLTFCTNEETTDLWPFLDTEVQKPKPKIAA